MNATAVVPQLSQFTICRGCKAKIAMVKVMPDRVWRAVDTEPHPLGEYALLRDGIRAVNLRHPWMDLDLADRHDGPCFWDHRKTCPARGVVTPASVLDVEGGYQVDPEKERARQRLKKADRSPWVKRNPGQ